MSLCKYGCQRTTLWSHEAVSTSYCAGPRDWTRNTRLAWPRAFTPWAISPDLEAPLLLRQICLALHSPESRWQMKCETEYTMRIQKKIKLKNKNSSLWLLCVKTSSCWFHTLNTDTEFSQNASAEQGLFLRHSLYLEFVNSPLNDKVVKKKNTRCADKEVMPMPFWSILRSQRRAKKSQSLPACQSPSPPAPSSVGFPSISYSRLLKPLSSLGKFKCQYS